jgi:LPXTG-motif cell wall-anchored protein
MKNSILYIVGAVALLGGGAFLFLKNKKSKDASKLAELQTLTTGAGTPTTTPTIVNPTTGAVVPKVDEVLPVSNSTKNAQEAVTLASQIFDLKNKKSRYSAMSIPEFSKTKEGSEDFFKNNLTTVKILKENALKSFDKQLKILNDKIVALGFVEVNGSIAKLNL